MIPRSVTRLLRDKGERAIEVREVLGQEASDKAIAAYAAAEDLWVITRDPSCADDARVARVPHVWIRTPQGRRRERDRLEQTLDEIKYALAGSTGRVTLFQSTIRFED
jgi:predicted nuclease of predicted toxin-antitoxin system